MKRTENRYERLDQIERLLSAHPDGLTTTDIARQCGVDSDTIRRDMVLLEGRGTGLIKDGWRYRLDHRRSLHTVKMTSDEIMALYLAARLLSRHSDEHNPHVVRALEKLSDAIRTRSPLVARHIDMAADAVRSRRIRPDYVESLETITRAWSEGRKVHIRYRAKKNEISERTIAPYYVEPSGIGYACYVIAFDEKAQSLRTFKIERIIESRLLDDSFTIPSAFNPQHLLANAWGVIWRDQHDITVVLRFSPAVAERVKESVWHHSQQICDLPDGSCEFEVHVGSTLEMKPWIRQWGADVLVLHPTELRDELHAEVRRMYQMYEQGAGDA